MTSAEVVALIYQELLKVAGGATVILAALSAFLGKIWIDRISHIESERRDVKIAELSAQLERQGVELKAKLDVAVQRTVHIDKVQFELELQIYRAAWDSLFSLRQATLSLRPVLDQFDPTESKEDRMRKRMIAFSAPYNKFLDVIEKSKPFYPEAVYQALAAVLKKCGHELIDYEYVERPINEYYKEAMKNEEEIIALIEAACTAIRTRISEVRTT